MAHPIPQSLLSPHCSLLPFSHPLIRFFFDTRNEYCTRLHTGKGCPTWLYRCPVERRRADQGWKIISVIISLGYISTTP
jgi:hypothetical protein